jgi:hypothetical protein
VDLSKAVAALALLLAAALAAGHARGNDKPTTQDRAAEREAQRRVAVDEHQRRKEDYVRLCAKPLMTRTELEACRAAYRRL